MNTEEQQDCLDKLVSGEYLLIGPHQRWYYTQGPTVYGRITTYQHQHVVIRECPNGMLVAVNPAWPAIKAKIDIEAGRLP